MQIPTESHMDSQTECLPVCQRGNPSSQARQCGVCIPLKVDSFFIKKLDNVNFFLLK